MPAEVCLLSVPAALCLLSVSQLCPNFADGSVLFQMAGIENSLATAAGTHRRKKENVPAVGARDVVHELELLHNTLKEKDQLILR